MTLLERLIRGCRTGAWRMGLVRDRTRAAARAIEAVIDARASALAEEAGVPGLSVAVRFAEGPTILRAVGRAGATGEMSPRTVFPVGSISKMVAAFCAMSLVERGVLSLDEPVGGKISSWRMPAERLAGASYDAITLRRLLSHSAGFEHVLFGHMESGPPPLARELLPPCDLDERALRLNSAPGTRFHYSSAGYALVQLLIEEATGAPFPEVARELVLLPLGMRSSGYEIGPEVAARLVTGHDKDGNPVPKAIWRMPADSGLFTTAEDVAAFWSVLVPGARGEPAGRGALSPASCRQILSIQIAHPKGGGWGLGPRLRTESSDVRYQHGGRYAGCFCYVQGLVRRRVSLAVLSNADGGADCVLALCRDLRHVLHRLAL